MIVENLNILFLGVPNANGFRTGVIYLFSEWVNYSVRKIGELGRKIKYENNTSSDLEQN